MRRSFIRSLAPLAAIALIAGACSDDDDDGGGGSAEPTLPGSAAPDLADYGRACQIGSVVERRTL